MSLESDRSVDELVETYPSYPYPTWRRKEIAAKVFRGGPTVKDIEKMREVDGDWAEHQMEIWRLSQSISNEFKHPATFWFDAVGRRMQHLTLRGEFEEGTKPQAFGPQYIWQEDIVRQSGRTTRRLLEGISEILSKAASCREVVFVGPTRGKAQYIQKRFERLLDEASLGISPELQMTSHSSIRESRRGRDEKSTVWIVDHTWNYNQKRQSDCWPDDMDIRQKRQEVVETLEQGISYFTPRQMREWMDDVEDKTEELRQTITGPSISPLSFESLH